MDVSLPVTLGHQVVGQVVGTGSNSSIFKKGDRVGIAWIYSACGTCFHCCSGLENLCSEFLATGRDAAGGYAEYIVVSEDFAYLIPKTITDAEAAPFLCAGAIGFRSLQLANMKNGCNLGLTGFGASAHLVLKMIQYIFPDCKVFVFARNLKQQKFALDLGAFWAGGIQETAPEKMHGIIDTTPAWQPVISALENLHSGGRLIINAIRKETKDQKKLLNLSYERHLWQEKEVKSVANVTRKDVVQCLKIAAEMNVRPEVEEYHFLEVNRALCDLKAGAVCGAKVLRFA